MNKNFLKGSLRILLIYIIIAFAFKWIAGGSIAYQTQINRQVDLTTTIGPVTENTSIKQEFMVNTDTITSVSLCFGTFGSDAQATMGIQLTNITDDITYPEYQFDTPVMSEGMWYDVMLPEEIQDARNKKFLLTINCYAVGNSALALYYNNLPESSNIDLYINQEHLKGELAMGTEGKLYYSYYEYYWYFAAIAGGLILLYLLYTEYCIRHKKKNAYITLSNIAVRYKFLIKQLVGRDFKNKYKRSILGYLWSFLNPVLTMAIQYVVFSTIFRSDIKNFPVYLLSGVVFFNFFTESVGQGLMAIVGNASLITKVYVPKYIYPITKVWSSSINLIISLVPLLLLALITGAPVNKTVVLLILPIAAILTFCMGMSLLLSTAMVFFRDTQYLWGIVSLAWMYATPLFYPESILPESARFILKINPLYPIIKFVRTVLINGVSPEPMQYVYCIAGPLIVLAIGAFAFKKNQNKFVLYI